MNNSTVAHNWANQIGNYGKGSNFFFENDAIYSYGYHFKIAKLFPEKNLVLFNCSSYSNTTSKHQAYTMRAIPSHLNLIKCKDVEPGFYGHKTNILYFLNSCKNLIRKAETSRKYKDFELSAALRFFNDCKLYIQLFDLKIEDFNSIVLQSDDPIHLFQECEKMLTDFENSEAYKKWLINKEIKRKEDELKQLERNAENIDKFRQFETNYVSGIPYNLLRVNKEKNSIETSLNITISVDVFLKSYNLLKNSLLRIGDKIAEYRFNGLENNIVQVGCHKILVSEIDEVYNQIK
jgi:hypothetical protein